MKNKIIGMQLEDKNKRKTINQDIKSDIKR